MLSVHLLGPIEVHRDGQPLDLGGPMLRATVAHLALDAGRVVSVERLIDRLWGDEPPGAPLGTLQSYVSRLRRVLEPGRGAGAAPRVLVSEAPGYVLRIPVDAVDVHRFRRLGAEGRAATAAGDHQRALTSLDAALELWRGPALAGIGPEDQIRTIVARLEEERDAAVEDRFDTLLALGRHQELVASLQEAVGEQPLRERLWALLALALYRCDRQADALRALSQARSVLLDELGLDPGPALRELESRILAQDPTLVLPTSAQPVAAAPRTVVETATAPTAELIGRSAEWQAATAAIEAAAAGRPGLVLIEGEPGIGKTTLCDALLAHARTAGWRTAVGRAVEPELAPSLWPWIEIVRSIAPPRDRATAAGDPVDDPWREHMVGGQETAGGALAAVELAERFVALIDRHGPARWVLLLDDLHWADRATLDVLRLVLERLGNRPVAVVGAHRPLGLVPDSELGDVLGQLLRSAPTTRVQVTPLDEPGVARLMEITTGVAPSAEIARKVRARAAGNPLFVSELARLGGERGLSDDSDVPAAIRDVVRSRLAALPEGARAELEVAAVLGERFDLRAAMAASERDADACVDALDAAIVTRILLPEDGGFRFAHALVRDAVLSEISTLRRARLHHRAAEAILAVHGEGPNEAEPIARHRLAAAPFSDPLVVARAAVRASDIARWRTALDVADWFAEQALELLTALPRSTEVGAVEIAALEALVGSAYRRVDDASLAAVAARIEAVADRTGSDAASALSLFLHFGGIDDAARLDELDEPIQAARELAARTKDSYAIVTTHFMLAAYDLLRGNLAAASEQAQVAIDLTGPDPDRRPDNVPLVLLPSIAGFAAAVRGDADLARIHGQRRAVAWMSERSEVEADSRIGLVYLLAVIEAMLGEPAAVLEQLGDTARPEDFTYVSQEAISSYVIEGWARAMLGDADGLQVAFDAMERLDRRAERTLVSFLRTLVAQACIEQGDRRAVELLDRARHEAESRGETFWLSETMRLQAAADVEFGDGTRAASFLDEAEALAREQGAGLVLERLARTRRGG